MPPFDPNTARPVFDPTTARPVERAPRRGQSRPALQEVEGALANVNRGIPFAQDVSGIARGLMDAGGVAATPGTSLADIAQAGVRGYQSQVQRGREAGADFRARRPNAAAFAEGTGGAIGVLPALRAPQMAVQTGRGLGLFARQLGEGAATGAAYGAAYGAGAGDAPGQPWQDRLALANESAAMGGVLGAAAPVAANVAGAALDLSRPAWRALANPRPIATQAAESGAGVFGTQAFGGGRRPPLRAVPPPPQGPPQLTPATQRRLPTLADRARMSADDVARSVGEAQRNPQGQTLVDIFGDAGVRQLRPIVMSPGRTGAQAAETLQQRSQASPEILVSSLRRNLNVAESRSAAIRRLEREYQQASAETYRPLFERPLDAGQRQGLQRAIETVGNVPLVSRAMNRADDLFNSERALGLAEGQVDDNFARWAHYLKMSLDDVINGARRDGSMQANELRVANAARRQLLDAMDQNIPGYREARQRWAGIAEAEEALDEGAQFLRMDADEVQSRMAEMTPFQREHARIGLAHDLTQRIGLAGNTVGNVNVANIQALRSPEMQRRLRAVFETEEQAADFLGTARTQNQLMRNASAWGGNSQTQGNIAYAEDGAMSAIADTAGQAATGNFGGALRTAGRKLGNAAFNNVVERSNNEFGGDLLRRIDGDDAKAFTEEVIRLLRQREAARQARTAATRTGAAAASATANQRQRP